MTKRKTPELARCPFCGSEARVLQREYLVGCEEGQVAGDVRQGVVRERA